MKVENGHKVKVEYKGTFDDGTVFDSSEGRDPLEFVAGKGMVVKGFDNAVVGMEVGEEKKVSIEPEEGYGQRNEQLTQEVPKSSFGDHTPKEGDTVGVKAPTGQVFPVKIIKVDGDKVKVDLNHPLAGKKLNFDIKIVDTQELSKEEKEALEKTAQGCGPDCGDKSCDGC